MPDDEFLELFYKVEERMFHKQWEDYIKLNEENNIMENDKKETIEPQVKYLAELAKDGELDLEKRQITKGDKAILKRIAKVLPNISTANELEKVVGSKLKENGMTTIEGKEIDDDKVYTVYANKQIKVNQYKRLIEAWKVYESPLGIIFYCCTMFGDEHHNNFVHIVNEYFSTNYAPLYPPDYEYDKSEG